MQRLARRIVPPRDVAAPGVSFLASGVVPRLSGVRAASSTPQAMTEPVRRHAISTDTNTATPLSPAGAVAAATDTAPAASTVPTQFQQDLDPGLEGSSTPAVPVAAVAPASTPTPPLLSQSEEEVVASPAGELGMTIKAYYVSNRIEYLPMLHTLFVDFAHSLQRDSVIVGFHDGRRPPGEADWSVQPGDQYMVVFEYGSVVFFNFSPQQQREMLSEIRSYCVEPYDGPRSEDYTLVVRPSQEAWSVADHDLLYLKRLDVNNLRVISGVLGQTVALDHYERKVDDLLRLFSGLNGEVQHKGMFEMKKKKLFQLVAVNNTILTEVITKLGLLERSDTAWKYAQYAVVFDELRDEFELEQRFKNVDFKLSLVAHNTKFFLEVLHGSKSNNLEVAILVLIGLEICLGVYEIATRVPGMH